MLAFCPAPVVFHSVPSGTTRNHSETTQNRVEPSGIDRNHSEPIRTSLEVLGTDRFHSVPVGHRKVLSVSVNWPLITKVGSFVGN